MEVQLLFELARHGQARKPRAYNDHRGVGRVILSWSHSEYVGKTLEVGSS